MKLGTTGMNTEERQQNKWLKIPFEDWEKSNPKIEESHRKLEKRPQNTIKRQRNTRGKT